MEMRELYGAQLVLDCSDAKGDSREGSIPVEGQPTGLGPTLRLVSRLYAALKIIRVTSWRWGPTVLDGLSGARRRV
jgi:hypothetical protein